VLPLTEDLARPPGRPTVRRPGGASPQEGTLALDGDSYVDCLTGRPGARRAPADIATRDFQVLPVGTCAKGLAFLYGTRASVQQRFWEFSLFFLVPTHSTVRNTSPALTLV